MRDETFDGWTRRLASVSGRRGVMGRALALGTGAWIAESFPLSGATDAEAAGKRCRQVSERKVRRYIKQAARRYKQPYKKMLCVAQCESNFNNCAVNREGRTYGVFQFKRDTWDSTRYRKKDLWDPKWNALAAAWMWSQGRENEWDCCCPKFKCNCPGKQPSWC